MPWECGAEHGESVERGKRNKIEETEEEIDECDGRGQGKHGLVESRHRPETHDEPEDDREKDVRRASGDGNEGLTPALIFKIERVIRYRFRPAEEYRRVSEDEKRRKNDRAQGIDVRKRIEGEASGKSRALPLIANTVLGS